MVEYKLSIYGRKRSEWDQLESWIVNNDLYSENVVWLIQLPRLYNIYKEMGIVTSFQNILDNIFLLLFEDMTTFILKSQFEIGDKASAGDSEEVDVQRGAKITAIQGIRSISNWLYWLTPTPSSEGRLVLVSVARRWSEPDMDKIRNAAKESKLLFSLFHFITFWNSYFPVLWLHEFVRLDVLCVKLLDFRCL